jgi:hypothetical protein
MNCLPAESVSDIMSSAVFIILSLVFMWFFVLIFFRFDGQIVLIFTVSSV